MEIKRYDTTATMSRVTEAGGFLYFSGHVASKGETMTQQAEALFRPVRRAVRPVRHR